MSLLSTPDEPKPPAPPPVSFRRVELSPEELKMYKDCCFSMYYKAGLPFALFWQLVSTMRKPVPGTQPVSPVVKGLIFCGNVILGSFLFSPICFHKLQMMHAEIEKKMKSEEAGFEPLAESEAGKQPAVQTDDFSYPTDLLTSLNDPGDSFSSDFSASKSFLDDDDKQAKPMKTTYQELRARNRSHQAPFTSPGSGPIIKPESTEQPPVAPRRVVKNKYGDEFE